MCCAGASQQLLLPKVCLSSFSESWGSGVSKVNSNPKSKTLHRSSKREDFPDLGNGKLQNPHPEP